MKFEELKKRRRACAKSQAAIITAAEDNIIVKEFFVSGNVLRILTNSPKDTSSTRLLFFQSRWDMDGKWFRSFLSQVS